MRGTDGSGAAKGAAAAGFDGGAVVGSNCAAAAGSDPDAVGCATAAVTGISMVSAAAGGKAFLGCVLPGHLMEKITGLETAWLAWSRAVS
jgi:hypothetical protein